MNITERAKSTHWFKQANDARNKRALVYAFERRSANDTGMLGLWGMDAEDIYLKRAERVSLRFGY